MDMRNFSAMTWKEEEGIMSVGAGLRWIDVYDWILKVDLFALYMNRSLRICSDYRLFLFIDLFVSVLILICFVRFVC